MQSVATVQAAAHWLHSRGADSLCTDSRQLRAGDGLLAWPGSSHDARTHVQRALALGAVACMVETRGAEAFHFDDERITSYPGLKRAGGLVADHFYDHPSHALPVLAVTGTNGKTSTVWWLAQALSGMPGPDARLCGMVGTLGAGFVPVEAASANGASLVGTGLTTPDGVRLQAALRDMCSVGARACAIEASSIGIVEQRLAGTRIQTAIFTNFTQDHLDYHGSMEAYWRAKESLFDWPDLQAAVVNTDDPVGARLALSLQHRPLDLWTVSCTSAARLRACDVEARARGLRFVLQEGAERQRVTTGLIGHYNVSNLLGVVAAMRTIGIPLADAAAACNRLTPVPGRLQTTMLRGKPMAVVDYAHTPDALQQVLAALRPVATRRGGQLWCVFGCGGDRDSLKRPLMGAAAA
ncbi:MAG: UDP-N-acetylmuramoyl-L-alanyl-D-glutamate--2,6-diaminopimelate ligase, partial [Rhodoferax sp.]|nr:UDP-N-acetylmuramoyl-L-alanyl-D-glutamate--2,6-diaminopimelate ligase [Rhodoferax sp.]